MSGIRRRLKSGCLEFAPSVQEERTEALETRIESRSTRRQMRAEAEDERYHDWYYRAMGRRGGGY
ncbi:MAG: hypothetical protein ACKV19_26935 [Verrucomicrobiales bacterium]